MKDFEKEIARQKREEYITILDSLGFNTHLITGKVSDRLLLEFCTMILEMRASEGDALEEARYAQATANFLTAKYIKAHGLPN